MKYEDCEHKWNSGDDIRVCLKCGQVRTFPAGDDAPVVLWVSRGDDRDPTALPKQWKSAIAHLAKTFGIRELIALTGIPLSIIRGWVGAYCHKPKLPETITLSVLEPVVAKRKYNMSKRLTKSPKSPLSTEVNKSDPQVVSHNSLELAPEVAKAVNKLLKSDHKVDLPPFPPFSNDWLPEVQMEWLDVYSGLVKGSK